MSLRIESSTIKAIAIQLTVAFVVLPAIGLGCLSLLAFIHQRRAEEWGEIIRAQSDIRALGTLLKIYKQAHDSYPADSNEVIEFVASRGIRDPERMLTDPWGRRYLFKRNEAEQLFVYSSGPNRKDENGGGDDITTDP